MCVGVFESRTRQRYLLLETAQHKAKLTSADILLDPCYPTGAEILTSQYELLMPCTLSSNGKRKLRKYLVSKKKKLGKMLVSHEIKENILEREKMIEEFANLSNSDTREVTLEANEGIDTDVTAPPVPYLEWWPGAPTIWPNHDSLDKHLHIEDNRSPSNLVVQRLKRKYRVLGSSDGEQCFKRVRELFDPEVCSDTFHYGSCLSREVVPSFQQDLLVGISVRMRLNAAFMAYSGIFLFFGG